MRRYLLYFAVSVAIVLGPTAYLSLMFEPISGDLTRIGNFAESDYGWNSPQPEIKVRGNGKSIAAPDVLVLGDSFARANIWQSVLSARLDKSFLSFQFDQVGCLGNWVEYAARQRSAGAILIETVERVFVERFRALPDCQAAPPLPFEMAPWTSAAKRADWPPEWHIRHTILTAWNLRKVGRGSPEATSGEVANAPIDGRCAKFSNRRNDRILYYLKDRDKLRWDREERAHALSNVRRLQQLFAEHGKRFALIIVPDKLSVYRNCLLDGREPGNDANVTAEAIAAGIDAPDLLHPFQENSGRITDLYLPDNTHLSQAGYILMADRLEQFFAGHWPRDGLQR